MIVYKQWRKSFSRTSIAEWSYEGWFLFGIIPLYVRRFGERRV